MATIAERIAALKLQSHAGEIPVNNGAAPPSTNGTRSSTPRTRPPPPPRPDRTQTASVPAVTSNSSIGNQPQDAKFATANGAPSARPPLPSRTSTQSSQPPPLPSRTPSDCPTPALPPRRPSEAPSQPDYDRSRRGSSDSQNSVATTRSSVSGISTATSITSQGERYKIRAPEFDPSSLPTLPPKRTKEEREAADRKYAGLRPVRTKSTPKVAQTQQGTTPPPPIVRPQVARPPPLPGRTPSVPEEPRRIESSQQTARAEPPPSAARPQLAQPPKPRPSALSYGFNNKSEPPPPTAGAPPQIPVGSKPDLTALLASKPNPSISAVPASAPVGAGPVVISSYPQFSQILSTHRVVVADFYADWCGPCREFAPSYTKLSEEYSRPNQISYVKLNTDHNPDIRDAYQIRAWPTIIIFYGGSQVEKFEGANEWGITSTVKELAQKAGIDLSAPAPSLAPVPNVSSPSAPPAQDSNCCLRCRDFSGPDSHAARFPRESLPSQDLGWLATQLTSPFPSFTDKARAIFTWLHHNVAYNTAAFFANAVKPSTPQATLQSGLAVCEGYAGLFAALAMKAGLESIVIGGGSKGFGYTPLQPGQSPPAFKSTHAWNAVKIDGGEWKLIDTCWGAGNVDGATKSYNKAYAPERFTQSNDDFGLDHYPEDSSKQFRSDGRSPPWAEWYAQPKKRGGAEVYGMADEEGFDGNSFQPGQGGKIHLSQQPGPTVRFAFQKICRHWDPIRNGRGQHYIYVLNLDAQKDNKERNLVPFQTNGDVWWCDVPIRDLGRPGQHINIWAMTTFAGKDGRGLSVQDYNRQKGRVGWGGGGLCKWELA